MADKTMTAEAVRIIHNCIDMEEEKLSDRGREQLKEFMQFYEADPKNAIRLLWIGVKLANNPQ